VRRADIQVAHRAPDVVDGYIFDNLEQLRDRHYSAHQARPLLFQLVLHGSPPFELGRGQDWEIPETAKMPRA